LHADAEVQAGRPTRWLATAGLGLAALLVTLVWLLIALGIRTEFRRATEAAQQASATFARTLEAEVAGRFRSIETLFRLGAALHAHHPAGFDLRDWIGGEPDGDIIGAAIIGPDGRVRRTLDGVPPVPPDLSDQPYIAAILADPSQDRLEISAPLAGPGR
jgi:hypothetical protein